MLNDTELKELLKALEEDGRITCEEAWDFADKHSVPKAKVGSLLDDIGIKIHGCQLGCF